MRQHWLSYPRDYIKYGDTPYGKGYYRVDSSGNQQEYWIDGTLNTDEDIKKYDSYLQENGWEDEIGKTMLTF